MEILWIIVISIIGAILSIHIGQDYHYTLGVIVCGVMLRGLDIILMIKGDLKWK